MHDGWRLVQDERRDLVLFFRSLTPQQWEEASLCAGWRITDVAAHLLIDEPVQAGSVRRVLPIMARHGFSVDRINSSWFEQNRQRTPESIVQTFLEDSDRGVGVLGHLLGPAVALRALVVHHQDMRRPLNLGRAIPADRLVAVLDGLMSLRGTVSIGSLRRAKGLRLRALDVDWLRGDGPEVRGPGEAILMALAGREAALADLEGDGKQILGRRMLLAAAVNGDEAAPFDEDRTAPLNGDGGLEPVSRG